MPKQEDLKPKTANNEEEASLADSKKIDLYINNSPEEEQGISIMNIFSTLGKRFRIYVFVIISCLLLGLLVPTLIYTFKDKKESAVAILGLDYAGAEAEQAPDGSNLDISYLKSSYIIQNALSDVTLSKKVSTAQVQANLTITGILTDETKQQKEIIDKLEEVKNNDYSKLLQQFKFHYRAQYFVSLNNIFRTNNEKIVLSSTDTSRLLSAIMDAYNDYFVKTYQYKSLPTNSLDAINVATLDYLDVLDEISVFYDYMEDYCIDRAGSLPGFRTSNGKSFDDLASMINTMKNTEIDDYYSYIYLNHISKDKSQALTNYKIQKRDAEYQLAEISANITTTQNSIDNYKPDKVKINNADGTGSVEVDVYPDAYYNLILHLEELNNQKSSLARTIAILTDRIAMLEGPDATDEQKANAQGYVDNAMENANRTYSLVNWTAKELFKSNAYKSKYMHTVTTYESEKLSASLKMFLIGGAAGLGIGLIAWVADAFIIEFKAVRKANERKEEN